MWPRLGRATSLLALTLCGVTTAGAQDSAFIRIAGAAAHPFTLAKGRIDGAGADFLRGIARDNAFITIGEDHGIREVPEFVGAAFALAREAGGYRHLGVEIGPVTTEWLGRVLRTPGGPDSVSALLSTYNAFSLPFANWREEAGLLERVVKSEPGEQDAIWGLDQEFVESPAYLFDWLARLAPNTAAANIARTAAREAREGDRKLLSDHNPRAVWMASSTDSSVATLDAAFHGASPAATRLLAEILSSRRIYRQIFAGLNFASNQERDALMKAHFLAEYAAARRRGESSPRVMLKLGSGHTYRGPSPNDTYELASFLPEFAIANGQHAFNILIVVVQGTQNIYRPFGSSPSDTAKAFSAGRTESDNGVLHTAVFIALAGNRPTIFDLRPLLEAAHDRHLGPLDEPIVRLLRSFDALVVLPEGHASTFFIDPQRP